MIHPSSDVKSSKIGDGTRIWQYCVVLDNAIIGEHCNICANVFIENDVVIGDRVTIKCGVQIWDGLRIGNDVFIGPNATFTNDRFPRSRQIPDKFLETTICDGASIGANATILPGLTIGRNAMIAAGAVVTRDVPPYAIAMGTPARVVGYTSGNNAGLTHPLPSEAIAPINGVDLVHFTVASDSRGDLLAVEFEKHSPFTVRRSFYVMNVPTHHVRGEHAHHQCHQLLVCLQGKLTLSVDNGYERGEWILDNPSVGIHLKPRIWASQWNYCENTILAVFASHPYDPDDYINDYEEFLRIVKN